MADVAVAERTLPHNLEAERSVLGAILLHNDAFNLAAEVIDSRDFFRDAHRRIFDKMVKLAERGDAIDLVTLKEELARVGRARRGRRAGLHRGARRRRAALDQRRALRADHQGEGDAPEPDLLGEQDPRHAPTTPRRRPTSSSIRPSTRSSPSPTTRCATGSSRCGTSRRASLDTIEKLHSRKELVTGVPTGFTDLDEMTSGLQPSDLVIVAARPSMGKTSLVLNMAQHVGTKTDMTVGIFSLEMSKEQLFLRMLTGEARIDAHRLRGGFLGERDWGKLSQAPSGRSARRRSSSTIRRRSACSRCARSAAVSRPSTACTW